MVVGFLSTGCAVNQSYNYEDEEDLIVVVEEESERKDEAGTIDTRAVLTPEEKRDKEANIYVEKVLNSPIYNSISLEKQVDVEGVLRTFRENRHEGEELDFEGRKIVVEDKLESLRMGQESKKKGVLQDYYKKADKMDYTEVENSYKRGLDKLWNNEAKDPSVSLDRITSLAEREHNFYFRKDLLFWVVDKYERDPCLSDEFKEKMKRGLTMRFNDSDRYANSSSFDDLLRSKMSDVINKNDERKQRLDPVEKLEDYLDKKSENLNTTRELLYETEIAVLRKVATCNNLGINIENGVNALRRQIDDGVREHTLEKTIKLTKKDNDEVKITIYPIKRHNDKNRVTVRGKIVTYDKFKDPVNTEYKSVLLVYDPVSMSWHDEDTKDTYHPLIEALGIRKY